MATEAHSTAHSTGQDGFRQERFQPPPGATELLLIRHGESEPARKDRPFPLVEGQGDPALAPEGQLSAQRVAQRLRDEPLDQLYVTTLRRTAQTAAPLAAHSGLVPKVEADLREVHLGEWEGGLFRQMVAEKHPLVLQMRAECRWDVIPGAESTESLANRVRGAIERLVHRHPGERLAVFTHGGVIDQALTIAAGARPFAFLGADNCSISRLVIIDETWLVRGFNDTAHLDSPTD
ncbi:putative phosphoglycerate mutase [Tamaricihabitans halophyticus]|uniref:Putative phosphoglycerate mutase n=1 Tax=Tamaricihabitans halophyticus TaxID=1262583 RepID=A0A4R2QE70_9PSEU|nr:histidine phosphatase family protein [Tamaricihabitans halophyticus]TCP47382.1 putative phosphoglycerate mutase [Tamaricihabitans halophyticus]